MAAVPDFAITPDEDELAQIDRDLQFRPTVCDQPQTLSPEQIGQFNRDGYLSGLTVFDADEMVEHRRFFDALLERVIAAGGDSYSISTAHLRYGRIYDLLKHPRIVSLVGDLLGENVVGWGTHYFCKMPHDGKSVAWHQDVSYWPLSAARNLTVWLAIDDVDRENACVRFIPGSHRHGHLEYRESDATEGNVLNQTIDAVEQYGKPVDICLKAGQVSIHSDLLLHGSEENDSDRRRCGLTFRYGAADVRAHLDWHRKGVIVRGTDPSGHWSNPPRPDSD